MILDELLVPGRVVWFGEVHGTNESPRFVGDVVERARRIAPVQLALEIAEHCTWDGVDGRHSRAMFALVERVRGVPIVAYDVPRAGGDREMAEHVLAHRDPRAIVIGLSGNVHSRRVRGISWDPSFVPLVAHLVEAGVDVTTLDASPRGGTFWAITDDGTGVHASADRGPGEPWTLGPPRDAAHDGVYYIGVTTASYPVRDTVAAP